MLRRPVFWAGLVAAMAVGVACSAAQDEPPVAAPEQPAQPAQPDAVQPDAAQPTPEEAEGVTPAPEQPVPGRPDAPAPVDSDFRPDPASVVAATGNPQLLEFFTYW